MEQSKEELSKEKNRRLKRKYIKFVLEFIFMGIIGFLVLYPFFLFFFNFLT